MIAAGFNQAYNVGVSDVDSTTVTPVEGAHQDHASDSSRFHKFDAPHKQPQTRQHGRNARISRSDQRFGVNVSTRSTNRNNLLDDYDDMVTTHTHDKDYPHTYTDLMDKDRSHDYYQNPDVTCTQESCIKGPTSDYAHTISDDGEYINNGMEKRHMTDVQTDSHPHTYSNDTERTHQGSTQHHDYEPISNYKRNATQDEESTSKLVTFDDGKYCGGVVTVPKWREKAQPGKHRVECKSDKKLQTVHDAFKSSLEETLRVDVNADLELLDHEQHAQVYASAQEYSNPECESEDNSTAKDHGKQETL